MPSYKQIHPSTFTSRITVKVPILLQDAAGGIATSGYDEEYSTFAHVDELSANRLAYFGMDLFTSAFEVTLRYNVDRIITTGTVIGYRDTEMIVKSCHIITQNYRRFIKMICVQSETS